MTGQGRLACMPSSLPATCLLFACLAQAALGGETVTVSNAEELREVLGRLAPGMTLKLQPGDYGADYSVGGVQGTAEAPVVIEAAVPQQPPVFSGGDLAIHFQGCSYLTLRYLKVKGQKLNGFNLDDQGDGGCHHIVLDWLDVSEIGPTGNCDGIKLSGVDDFVVKNCRVAGWGGQAVDMVGCHRGLIEDCRFEGLEGYEQFTGPQTKGGCEDIVIRACMFAGAGQRPAHLGGSTDREYFRPVEAKHEARKITVEGCLFVGGMAPVAFTGVEDGVVRYNTMVNPTAWALRILQENVEEGMAPCGGGCRFENNLVVVTEGQLREWVNIGPDTKPELFKFTGNWWFHHGSGLPAKPELPSAETGGTYGIDPQLDPAKGYAPLLPAAQGVGYTAWKRPAPGAPR